MKSLHYALTWKRKTLILHTDSKNPVSPVSLLDTHVILVLSLVYIIVSFYLCVNSQKTCFWQFVCLFSFFTSKSTTFQSCQEKFLSSWVKPVLGSWQSAMLKDTTQRLPSCRCRTSNSSISSLTLHQLSHYLAFFGGLSWAIAQNCSRE